MTKHLLCFATLALALGACGNTPASPDTGASPGNDAGNDAASVSMIDAGADAAAVPNDSGGVCHDDFSGCTTIEDHTGVATFTIAATASFTYDHHCVRISTGTVVTMENSLTHPLTGASCSTPGGPIPAVAAPATGTAHTTDYTFTTAGHYGYWCMNHGADDGGGMSGLIIVQ